MRLPLLVAALAGLLYLTPAQALAAAAPPTPMQRDRAQSLAELVAAAEVMLPMELNLAKQGFEAGFEADAEAKALMADNPGLQGAIWSAIEPEISRSIAEDHPEFIARVAALYRSRLTGSEIEGLHAFFGSSTGQKMLATMYGGFDAQPLITEFAKGAEQISAEALAATQERAKRKAVAGIGPGDEAALLALTRSISMQKMHQIGQELQKLTLDWVNEPDPAFDARLESLIAAAIERYFAKQRGPS